MEVLRIGIVGTGFIAQVIAQSLSRARKAMLAGVASRSLARAEGFAGTHGGVPAFEGWQGLVRSSEVDAVYIAVPTAAKEAIASGALAAGKHVLIDKPLASAASAERLAAEARSKGLALMDATHFVHHPRVAAVRQATPELIGKPRFLHTTFYFPFSDPTNIRLDPSLEPTGAVGDTAWYCMRAIVEFLRPSGRLTRVHAVAERRGEAVVQVSGWVVFADGVSSTFSAGYTAGTLALDLQLIGTSGIITMDDYAFDWNNSFLFQHSDIAPGFRHRTGMATPADTKFIATPSVVPQDVRMLEQFCEITQAGAEEQRSAWWDATVSTQRLVDAVWNALL